MRVINHFYVPHSTLYLSHGLPDLPPLSEASLAELQRKDPEIRIVIEGLEKGVKPCKLRDLLPTMSLWSKEWNRLELRSGVLCRSVKPLTISWHCPPH